MGFNSLKFTSRASVLLLSLAVISGCGKSSEDLASAGVESYQVEDENGLQVNSGQVLGSGKLRFVNPLMGINSKEHYRLGFRFLDSQKSLLVLHSHFSGFHREDGVRIELSQNGDMLQLQLSTPGFPKSKVFPLETIKPNMDVYLRLEVHDGVSTGIRVLVWLDQVSYKGEVLSRLERVQIGNHLFDSFDENLNFFSHGQGPFWGVELKEAVLIEAQREAAYVD